MLKFATFPTMVCCLLNAVTCLYVGSTRSLAFYNVKREDSKNSSHHEMANTENSLLSLKGALSIPVIATGTLLVSYLAVINQLDFVNVLLEGYFLFISVLVLKKYFYGFSQTNAALLNWD
jgi:hypothetical protein